jgi:hypothetical protein
MLEIEHGASNEHLYDYQPCEDSIWPIKIKLLSYKKKLEYFTPERGHKNLISSKKKEF